MSNVCLTCVLTVRRHVFDWHGKRGVLFHRRLFLRILLDRQQTVKRALYSDFVQEYTSKYTSALTFENFFLSGFFSIGIASAGHYALGMWAWGVVVGYLKGGQGLEHVMILSSACTAAHETGVYACMRYLCEIPRDRCLCLYEIPL